MPSKVQDEDQRNKDGAQIISPSSTAYSQPWWHKVGAQVEATSDGVANGHDSSTAPQSGISVNCVLFDTFEDRFWCRKWL